MAFYLPLTGFRGKRLTNVGWIIWTLYSGSEVSSCFYAGADRGSGTTVEASVTFAGFCVYCCSC